MDLIGFVLGRWAQRVGSQGITVKSHYDSDSVIPFPAPKFDSDSKESSLEPPAHLQGQGAKVSSL